MNLGMMGGNPALFGGSRFFFELLVSDDVGIYSILEDQVVRKFPYRFVFGEFAKIRSLLAKRCTNAKKKARIYCMLSLGDITCHQTLSQAQPHVHTSAPFCTHNFSTSASASRVQARPERSQGYIEMFTHANRRARLNTSVLLCDVNYLRRKLFELTGIYDGPNITRMEKILSNWIKYFLAEL